MTKNDALSIIADIKPNMKQALFDVLERIDATKNDLDSSIPFKKMSTVHFACILILPESTDASGAATPASLAFTTNFDLPLDEHIQQLVDFGGKGIWQLFSFCDNFPQSDYDPVKLRQYMLQQNKKADSFYVGVGNRSVQQIHNERILRDEIENFIDTNKVLFENKDALYIRNQIIEHINTNTVFIWAKSPEATPSFLSNFKFYVRLILAVLITIVLLPILLPFAVIFIVIILFYELKDKPPKLVTTRQHARDLVEKETGMVQAQFAAVGNLKLEWFRLPTVLFMLKLTGFLNPYLFNKGKLAGIPTVHFARWLIINKNKQMLFLSNYDGNSESYLRDFINIAGKPLTLLFSHTVGYPKTWLMIFGGAKDAKGFMEWARYNQIVTNVWYSANKEVSVNNIYNNSKIRNGLYGTLTEEEALKWLSLI